MILNPKSGEGGDEIYPLDPWKMVYFTYIDPIKNQRNVGVDI